MGLHHIWVRSSYCFHAPGHRNMVARKQFRWNEKYRDEVAIVTGWLYDVKSALATNDPIYGILLMLNRKAIYRTGLIVLLMISTMLCPLMKNVIFRNDSTRAIALARDVTFVPHVTPAHYYTAEPDYLATAVYNFGPADLAEAGFYSPTYRWVPCERGEGGVCYELCYGGNCYVYNNKDGRVDLFVELVKERETNIDELEAFKRGAFGRILNVFGDCLKGTAGGGIIYGLFTVAVADPEPLTKGFVSGVTALGAIVVCGGSIWEEVSKGSDKDTIIRGINAATSTAIDIFLDLERNPPE